MAAADESLAAVGIRIRRKFEYVEQQDKEGAILWNEYQRFRLWASSIGLYRRSHSSLDYRLRESPLLFEYTVGLLHNLEDNLSNYAEHRSDNEDLAISDPDDDAPTVSDDDSEKDFESYRDQHLSAAWIANIGAAVDRLCRLSFEVRNPSIRLGLSEALQYFEFDPDTRADIIEGYAAVDLSHLKDIFHSYGHLISDDPTQPHYLVQRLAKANTRRRQQFMYWQKCNLRSQPTDARGQMGVDSSPSKYSNPPQVRAGKLNLTDRPHSQRSTGSGRAHTTPERGDTSTITTSSVIELSAEKDGDHVVIPSPPRVQAGARELQCPYCCIMCPASTFSANGWETHVFRDLRPYVCTYDKCRVPDQQYDSLVDWIAHETSNHGAPATRTCPICRTEASTPAHIALHLRRIACFILPIAATGQCGSITSGGQVRGAHIGTIHQASNALSLSDSLGGRQDDSTHPDEVSATEIVEEQAERRPSSSLSGRFLEPDIVSDPWALGLLRIGPEENAMEFRYDNRPFLDPHVITLKRNEMLRVPAEFNDKTSLIIQSSTLDLSTRSVNDINRLTFSHNPIPKYSGDRPPDSLLIFSIDITRTPGPLTVKTRDYEKGPGVESFTRPPHWLLGPGLDIRVAAYSDAYIVSLNGHNLLNVRRHTPQHTVTHVQYTANTSPYAFGEELHSWLKAGGTLSEENEESSAMLPTVVSAETVQEDVRTDYAALIRLALSSADSYLLSLDINYLRRAIDFTREAAYSADVNSLERYKAACQLGRFLRAEAQHQERSDGADDWIESVVAASAEYAGYYDLAKNSVRRYERSASLEHVKQAIEIVNCTIAAMQPGNPAPWQPVLDLGQLVLREWQRTGTLEYKDEITQLLILATSKAGLDSEHAPIELYELHHLLGQVLVMLWERIGIQEYLTDAGKVFEQALQGFKLFYGPEHGRSTDVMAPLADVYWDQDRPLDAMDLYSKVLGNYTAVLGPDDSKAIAARQRWEQRSNHYKTRTAAEAQGRLLE